MGLGDLVYYFTKYTGIRYVWKKINPIADAMNVGKNGMNLK